MAQQETVEELSDLISLNECAFKLINTYDQDGAVLDISEAYSLYFFTIVSSETWSLHLFSDGNTVYRIVESTSISVMERISGCCFIYHTSDTLYNFFGTGETTANISKPRLPLSIYSETAPFIAKLYGVL